MSFLFICEDVLLSFGFQIDTVQSHLRVSTEELPRSDWPVVMSVRDCLPAPVGGVIPRQWAWVIQESKLSMYKDGARKQQSSIVSVSFPPLTSMTWKCKPNKLFLLCSGLNDNSPRNNYMFKYLVPS